MNRFIVTLNSFNKKDYNTMFTTRQDIDFKKPDMREALIDMSIHVGSVAWRAFVESSFGRVVLALLPSDEVRDRAQVLFLLGFSARMTFVPPVGNPVCDDVDEDPLVDIVWEDYLRSARGKTVLDGDRYPDTPKPVLDVAKTFFSIGFKSGTIAVRELLKN